MNWKGCGKKRLLLSWNLLEGTEKNHEKLQSEEFVYI
jgi:hypothetical protein